MKELGITLNGASMINKFKSAMSSYPTGIVCVLTKNKDQSYSAIIANSFSSVSLKPLIVLWSLDIRSKKFKIINQSKNQIVAILSYNQKDEVNEIAFKNAKIDTNKFHQILKKSICYLECSKYKSIKVGDHYTNFLKVKKISDVKKVKSMVYFKRKLLKI